MTSLLWAQSPAHNLAEVSRRAAFGLGGVGVRRPCFQSGGWRRLRKPRRLPTADLDQGQWVLAAADARYGGDDHQLSRLY